MQVGSIKMNFIMEILFFLVIGIFGLLGIGLLFTGSLGTLALKLGGALYIGAAVLAFTLDSWWPLLFGFLLTHVVKYFLGDPSESK